MLDPGSNPSWESLSKLQYITLFNNKLQVGSPYFACGVGQLQIAQGRLSLPANATLRALLAQNNRYAYHKVPVKFDCHQFLSRLSCPIQENGCSVSSKDNLVLPGYEEGLVAVRSCECLLAGNEFSAPLARWVRMAGVSAMLAQGFTQRVRCEVLVGASLILGPVANEIL